jgi:hypothetical protein
VGQACSGIGCEHLVQYWIIGYQQFRKIRIDIAPGSLAHSVKSIFVSDKTTGIKNILPWHITDDIGLSRCGKSFVW